MRGVGADFSRPQRPALWTWGLLVLLGVLACTAVVQALRWHRALEEVQRNLSAQKAAEWAERNRPQPPPAPQSPYDASAKEFLAERNGVWSRALRVLEKVQVTGIQIQAFEFGSTDKRIRVEFTAPSHATAVEFVSALNSGNQGRGDEIQWVLAKSVAAEGSGVRAQIVGKDVP